MPPASSPVVTASRRAMMTPSQGFPLSPEFSQSQNTPSRSSSIGRRKSLRFGSQIASPDSKEERKRVDGVMDVYQAVVKLCNENKVTTKNSWALNLIENIDTVLGAAKGSFHKASCALSAAVEIYGQRVDGTHADTFKILETVTSGSMRGDADGEAAREKRKKSGNDHSASASLEMNLANITLASVERDFDVDPNMRKMMHAHDESGSKGMLLNHLGVHHGCSVVFDTSNVPAFERAPDATEPLEVAPYVYKLPDVRHASLCPTMAELRAEALGALGETVEKSSPAAATTTESQAASTVQNAPLLANETEEPEYYDESFDAGFDEEEEDEDAGGGAALAVAAASAQASMDNSSYHAPATSNSTATALVETNLLRGNGVAFSATSFFDPKLLASSRANKTKGWMGPSHWKFVVPVISQGVAGKTAKAEKKLRSAEKQELVIDFFAAPIDASAFAAPTRPSMTQISKSTKLAANPQHTLPVDVHFHALDLRRLFGKTHVFLSRDEEGRLALLATGEAKSAAISGNETGHATGSWQNHDNHSADEEFDDEAGFYDCEDDEDEDAAPGAYANLVAPAHHVEKIQMAFATRAKKVDVKKLKTDLWTCIEDNHKNTELAECVHQMQPTQKNESITVPFYFVCVLHLANEMGLELLGSSDLDDVVVRSGAK